MTSTTFAGDLTPGVRIIASPGTVALGTAGPTVIEVVEVLPTLTADPQNAGDEAPVSHEDTGAPVVVNAKTLDGTPVMFVWPRRLAVEIAPETAE